MYQIFTSCGLIISSKNTGESDKLLYILTKEFGLVLAIAHGIRFEKSKLRYHCQDLSFGSFSFIRGKEYYKLTGAEPVFESDDNDKVKTALFSKISKILKRLVQGEMPLFRVYEDLYFVKNIKNDFVAENQDILESIIVFRILYELGYIKIPHDFKDLVNHDFNIEIISKYRDKRKEINKFINKALKESHL